MKKSKLESALPSTITMLDSLPDWKEIIWDDKLGGEYKISTKPLASFDYRSCRGIVLFGEGNDGVGNRMALSHFSPEENIYNYLFEMISAIKNGFLSQDDWKIRALLSAGKNPREIETALSEAGIPVVRRHYDACTFEKGFVQSAREQKDIIAIPSTREVFIHAWYRIDRFCF